MSVATYFGAVLFVATKEILIPDYKSRRQDQNRRCTVRYLYPCGHFGRLASEPDTLPETLRLKLEPISTASRDFTSRLEFGVFGSQRI
ncbi:hypothetical protein VTO42DRAFT_51 [Malbranchea cinnamomea]